MVPKVPLKDCSDFKIYRTALELPARVRHVHGAQWRRRLKTDLVCRSTLCRRALRGFPSFCKGQDVKGNDIREVTARGFVRSARGHRT